MQGPSPSDGADHARFLWARVGGTPVLGNATRPVIMLLSDLFLASLISLQDRIAVSIAASGS
jgi:hypothetical protein